MNNNMELSGNIVGEVHYGAQGLPGPKGKDGGYYTPAVTQPASDVLEFSFTPSKEDMPAVEPVQVELPHPGGNVDLTGYATEQFVRDGYQPKGDYLESTALPTAINTALAQAKASGEFDGADGKDGQDGYTPQKGIDYFDGQPGKDGEDGKDGYTPVKGVDYFDGKDGADGAPGAKGDKGDTGAKGDKGDTGATGKDGNDGLPGADGAPGQDGYSPVRGIDYWTPEDIAAIYADIATELAKRGQLAPEFAESMEWLEANGEQDKLYVLNDKADPNYGMIYAWTLTQTEVESGGGYTNILPLAVNSDGTPYVGLNGEKGYKTNYRLNSSKAEVAQDGMCCTGFIPVTPGIDTVLRFKNLTPGGTKGGYIYGFGSDRSTGAGTNSAMPTTLNNALDSTTGVYTINLGTALNAAADTCGICNYIRISVGNINENTIITCNEEIKEGGSTIVTQEGWASTGFAFVPADYENRIINLEQKSFNHASRIIALEKGATTGGTDETETVALSRIQKWDKPIYDPAPVTLIEDSRVKPALTANNRTISAIYAKYRALMAAHPGYITETNMGKSSASDTFAAVDMLRFDFCEPGGLTEPTASESARHETKPTLIFLSGIHTEWVGVWGLYYALEEITTNPDFDDIRRNAHIVVIPCANPFCLTSQTAIDGWRMSHVNANGVAIHNNFGVNHITSGSVGEYNYGGSAPYSEPETQYIDAVMAEYPDAVAFVSCHNNDYSTMFGAPVIWASSATYHMCNMVFRLVDKLTKAWLDKYGQTLKDSIDQYKINMDASDYRLGRATMSTSKGTEQLNATKYGIMGVNLEISRMMKVFSGNTDGTSEVMTHGAEVYANFMRTLLWSYDHKDKKEYAPNLPWSE